MPIRIGLFVVEDSDIVETQLEADSEGGADFLTERSSTPSSAGIPGLGSLRKMAAADI